MLPLDIYLISFNCGRAFIDVDAFAARLFQYYETETDEQLPDIISISLQEIAPIAHAFLTASFLRPYYAKFVEAVQRAASGHAKYHLINTHNAGMTAIMMFAKENVMSSIQSHQTADVGVGMHEMGNKGAAAIRIFYASDDDQPLIPLTFVAAHLTPHEVATERRNKDWSDIVRGLVFSTESNRHDRGGLDRTKEPEAAPLLEGDDASISNAETSVSGMFNSYPLFFSGDLNYRASDTPPKHEDQTEFPQPVIHTEDSKHWSHLLPHDQLTRELRAGRTLHNLTEAPINFPPTYKLDVDKYADFQAEEPSVWHWASHRYPSWCDRILFSSYLSQAMIVRSYSCLPIQPTSDHRPVALAGQLNVENARVPNSITSYKSPFGLDTEWRHRRTTARRREVVVGVGAYLGLTWEGRGLLLATVIGLVGIWLVAHNVATS